MISSSLQVTDSIIISIDQLIRFHLGETHSVREFVEAAFQEIGKEIV